MKILSFFISLLFSISNLFALSVSTKDAIAISEKIWKNECGGTTQGLTTWNKGENFASLGIGHFIWYPTIKKEKFEETFPTLLKFLEQNKVTLPDFLVDIKTCPWKTREEFYQNIESADMKKLRQFLFDTKHLQAIFMANRLENTLPKMIEKLPKSEKEKVSTLFYKLANTPEGLYALIDYLNFKGSGLSAYESYQGKGWGLLQVLQNMQASANDLLQEFINSAKELLKERVKNAPVERKEDRWLEGWMNRLNTYSKTIKGPVMENLSKKNCVPCKKGMPPLEGESLHHFYEQLASGWNLIDEHHLEKEYTFPNFKEALSFTNKIAAIAEQEGHHPDIHLSYGKVKIVLWTHKINGLSENDFILAAKCDGIK